MSLVGLVPSRHDDDADAANLDHQITLVDHTKSDDDAKTPSDISSGAHTPLSPKPSSRLNRASIRKGLARQKYARWQQDRFQSLDEGSASGETGLVQVDSKGAQLQLEETIDTSSKDDSDLSRKKSKLERGKKRVKGLVNAKRVIKQSKEENAVVDVLYENQRGSFFLGVPLFSAKSLLNFDPAPWVDGKFKPTPVNITNAAVPDPSWDWAWPSWYVDMSHDVDEEGWEYSFSFRHGFAWHGTHPWFHSFVRRRRWLRKRVRKHSASRTQPDPKNFSDAHMLNSEYFSIHTAKNKLNTGLVHPDSPTQFGDQELEEEDDDISTMARLISRLKKASIDRERLILVRRFLDEGGEELHYLAEQVPTLMSLFVFQSSRKQLLSLLLRRFEAASAHREEHKDREQPESSPESRKIDNLLNALHAADEECRNLEYWSDIRQIAKDGDSLGAADPSHGWGHGWHGLDDSGPGETDEGGAERFKEEGNPAQKQGGKDSMEEPETPQKDAGSQNQQPQEEQHDNKPKDKGKGKAET